MIEEIQRIIRWVEKVQPENYAVINTLNRSIEHINNENVPVAFSHLCVVVTDYMQRLHHPSLGILTNVDTVHRVLDVVNAMSHEYDITREKEL